MQQLCYLKTDHVGINKNNVHRHWGYKDSLKKLYIKIKKIKIKLQHRNRGIIHPVISPYIHRIHVHAIICPFLPNFLSVPSISLGGMYLENRYNPGTEIISSPSSS